MANRGFTPKKARDMVDLIEKAAAGGDDEAAHGIEDDLRKAALEAIADGSPQPKALARIALSTSRIEFKRSCA